MLFSFPFSSFLFFSFEELVTGDPGFCEGELK